MSQDQNSVERWSGVAVVAGLSLVPVVGGPLSIVAEELVERRARRSAQLGSDLLEDHDADAVISRLRDDERFGELFVRAAESVAVTWWAPKRVAMGKVVRAVLEGDDATVDENELLLLALERLDAPHFGALARVVKLERELGENSAGLNPEDVPGLSPPVLSALVSVGAIDQRSGWGGLFYRPTDFGHHLLALVTA